MSTDSRGGRRSFGTGGRQIRILYLIGALDVGGTEGQLVELASRLDSARFAPTVCALYAGGARAESLRRLGIRVEVLNFRGLGKHRGIAVLWRLPTLLLELAHLARFLRAEKPEIVHGFLFQAYVPGALAARLAGVPVVIASRRSLGRFKEGHPLYLSVERLANRVTDLVVANSEAVRQDVLRQEGLPPAKVIVILNGVDPSRFADPAAGLPLRQALDLHNRRPVVGVVANFRAYKGHEYFLEAWRQVYAEFPEGLALLLGEGSLRPTYEARARAMGLGESVRFLGVREDIPAVLTVLDLFVHPSREEGFPNAVLEAMAAGKPIVATNVGGTPEAVVHGESGLLVPPEDPPALAEAMIRLLRRPAEAARLGEAARRRVVELFQVSSMIRQYEEVYEHVVAQKGLARTAFEPQPYTGRVR